MCLFHFRDVWKDVMNLVVNFRQFFVAVLLFTPKNMDTFAPKSFGNHFKNQKCHFEFAYISVYAVYEILAYIQAT